MVKVNINSYPQLTRRNMGTFSKRCIVVLLGRETVSTYLYLKAYSDTRMISDLESGCLRNNEGLLPAHAAASPLSPPWLGSSVKWNL